jgi:hypothetical protein
MARSKPGCPRITAAGRTIVNDALNELSSQLEPLYSHLGPLDRAEAAAAAAAGVLFAPFGTAVDGAAGVQPLVPLVRGTQDRRSSLAWIVAQRIGSIRSF